jgi:hydrogenase-4 component F
MTLDALTAILLIPAVSAAVLAVLPGYLLTAKLNVVAALATFLTSLSLFVVEPVSGNICWWTTSIRSSSC